MYLGIEKLKFNKIKKYCNNDQHNIIYRLNLRAANITSNFNETCRTIKHFAYHTHFIG